MRPGHIWCRWQWRWLPPALAPELWATRGRKFQQGPAETPEECGRRRSARSNTLAYPDSRPEGGRMRAEYSRIPLPFGTWPSTMSNCALLINGPIVIPSNIPSPTRLDHYNGIRRPRPCTPPNRWRDRPLTVHGREYRTLSRIGGHVVVRKLPRGIVSVHACDSAAWRASRPRRHCDQSHLPATVIELSVAKNLLCPFS